MAKYSDRHDAGQSDRCPYKPGESPSQRHERRKRTAHSDRDIIKSWCRKRNFTLEVHNRGHHWQIRSRDGEEIIAEWWPASAKLVILQEYRHGIHCHDAKQVVEALNKRSLAT